MKLYLDSSSVLALALWNYSALVPHKTVMRTQPCLPMGEDSSTLHFIKALQEKKKSMSVSSE